MSTYEFPKELVEYFQSFIDRTRAETKDNLFRYARPPESAYWTAYDKFDITRAGIKKMCTTLFPMLNIDSLSTDRIVYIIFGSFLFDYAKPVSYSYYSDPITGDILVPREFEVSVYAQDLREVNMNFINVVRFHRFVKVSESEYRKAKSLPIYLYGKVYSRYSHTFVSERLLIKYLAIQYVLRYDSKMTGVFMYAWDKYWEDQGKIAYPPNYAKTYSHYIGNPYDPRIIMGRIHDLCEYVMLPEHKCLEVKDKVVEEIKNIYGLVGEETEVYTFSYPTQAKYIDMDRELKWWFGTKDELEAYNMSVTLKSRYEREMSATHDYEVIIEDGWEP